MKKWTCEKCGYSFTISVAIPPVRCKCRHVDHDGSGFVDIATGEQIPRAAIKSSAQPIFMECVHRGDVLRTELCPSCRGQVAVKIFACARHGECVISKGPGRVYRCDGGIIED